ncbi:MAG TPA: aminotransferase class IV, partial [Casimicrobiaceae bacterium]|nr:aminotransferase class IV [Casimicrobiaceae bacterium]
KRDHAFPADVPPTVFMMSNPLTIPTRDQVERGVAVVTAEDNRWHRCDLKTTSLLGNVLMRQLAADVGATETILFRDGYLTEASASNVLAVKNGTVLVPPKDNLILPGITYDATLEVARSAGVPVEIRPVAKSEALSADELWLSSSTKEVLAITSVDGKPFATGVPGPVFKRVYAAFQASKPQRERTPA